MASPYDKARPILEQRGQMYNQQLNPYVERGMTAGNNAADIYGQMASDPGAYYDQIASSYNPKKGWDDYKHNELMRGLKARSAAGGYSGTDYDTEMQSRLFNDLLESDRDKWLDRVLGINSSGLEGQTHFADAGQNASTNLAELQGNNLGEQAELAYKAQADKNAKKNALLRALIQGGATLGGAFLGGPAGASAGSALGGAVPGGFGGGQSLDSGNWKSNQPADFFGYRGGYGR